MLEDPYKYYRVEARELLDGLSKGTLALGRSPSDGAVVKELLRLAHTLKGASRVVKQVEVADLAHAIEEILAPFRDPGSLPSREDIDRILGLLDQVTARVSALEPLPAAGQNAAAAEEPLDSVRIPVPDLDHVVRGVFETAVQAKSLRQPLAAVVRADEIASLLREQLASPRFTAMVSTVAGRRLLALAEELCTTLGHSRRELSSGIEHTEAELAQVRDGMDQLRLLSAGSVFAILERAARDAATATGRAVRFDASGADVKLDAHVLGVLRDAMLHLVRNAVAHGVEPPTERSQQGKPLEGQISVAFERRGQRVAFLCGDDGRGIDVASVAADARRRGLVPDGEPIDPERAVALLLQGGISTSATVTEVAGRGIGLDVVRAAAETLKGEVLVRTRPNQGTTVEICVPVSLSSARALFMEAGGAPVCVPLDAVRCTLQVRNESIARSGDSESIAVDGEVMPFVSLARVLRRGDRALRSTWQTVVVQAGGRAAALAVERLLGTSDVVVRRLPATVQAEPFIGGAALDADGTPQLVLDAAAVVTAASSIERAAGQQRARERPRVLVIDDSLTTRMLEQSILESADYQVELASSGEEALQKAQQSRFDLFLVDIEMPGIDGFEFIRQTHEAPLLRGTPSILVTSRSSPEDRRRGEEVGARAYVAKGEFEQGVLLNHIRELVP